MPDAQSEIQVLFFLLLSSALINNFVLIRFLGLCPFMGISRHLDTSIGMGMAVLFVMTLFGAITWIIQEYVLMPLNLNFLSTLVFILVIASLVQLVELVVHKMTPGLYKALGIYLPLITTNCAVLGVALLNIREGHSFLESTVFSIGAALGWMLAIIIFAGIRERQELADIPPVLKGFASAFITVGLLSIAFFSFSGFFSS